MENSERAKEKRRDIIKISTAAVIYLLLFIPEEFDWWLNDFIWEQFPDMPFYLHLISYSYIIYVIVHVLLIRFALRHTFKEAGFIWNKETTIIALFCAFYLPLTTFLTYITTDVWWPIEFYFLIAVSNFLLTALYEELFHRGFLSNKLFKFVSGRRSFIIVVLISALFFCTAHVQKWVGEIQFYDTFTYLIDNLTLVFGMGVWTAVYYFYTKNLTVCIILHGAHNCIVNFTSTVWASFVFCWGFWAVAVVLLFVKVKKSDFNALVQKWGAYAKT